MPPAAKAAAALRTIGEVAQETGVAAHILRFWEAKFPQLRPLQRAGGRRYYRTDDVALVRRIARLLTEQGYTIRGVQQLLAAETGRAAPAPSAAAPSASAAIAAGPADPALRAVRALLTDALAADDAAD